MSRTLIETLRDEIKRQQPAGSVTGLITAVDGPGRTLTVRVGGSAQSRRVPMSAGARAEDFRVGARVVLVRAEGRYWATGGAGSSSGTRTVGTSGGGGGIKLPLNHSIDLVGLEADDHSQYLTTGRHDLTARHPVGTVVPSGAVSIGLGSTASPGVADSVLRSDATLRAFDDGLPTSLIANEQDTAGTAAYAARRDHRHYIGTAAPPANLSALTSNGEGVAASFARSDHSHAITSTYDATQSPGALLRTDNAGDAKLHRLTLSDRLTTSLVDSGAGTALRLQPALDLELAPGSGLVKARSGVRLQSDHFASQTTGWGVGYEGDADFRKMYADELHVRAFIADLEQALAGGQIISKSVALLAANVTVPNRGSSTTIKVRDFPGHRARVFADGDWVRLRVVNRDEATENLVLNPRPNPDGSASYWTVWANEGTNTVTNVSSPAPVGPLGFRSLKCSFTGVTTPGIYAYATLEETAAAGAVYSYRFWVKADIDMELMVALQEDGGSWSVLSDIGYHNADTVWRLMEGTVTVATGGTVRLQIWANRAGGTFYLANVQVERKDRSTAYCDGELGDGHAWEGPAHNSHSTRQNGALVVADAYGTVTFTSRSDLEKTQSYSFARPAADTGAAGMGTVVEAESLVLDYGVSGDGYHEVSAIDFMGAPYSQAATWTDHPATRTVHARVGNLGGITGQTEWGLIARRDPDRYVVVSDRVAEIKGITQRWTSADADRPVRGEVLPDASGSETLFWLGSGADKMLDFRADGTLALDGRVLIGEGGRTLFNTAGGLLLLDMQTIKPIGGAWCLVGSRGERAVITGAIHQEPSRFPGRRALVVEKGTTNLCIRPTVESADSVGEQYDPSGYLTATHQTSGGLFGPGCYRLVATQASAFSWNAPHFHGPVGFPLHIGETKTVSVYIWGTGTWRVVLEDAGQNLRAWRHVTVTNQPQRVVVTWTNDSGSSYPTNDNRVSFFPMSAGTLYVDGIQYEADAFATSYCDGSLGAGYIWNGAPHAATSSRDATAVNLDNYAGVLSGRSQLTIHARVRVPYAADGTWPDNHNMVFDCRGADDNHRIFLAYLSANKAWYLYVNGGYRVSSRTQSFQASDEITLDAVLDFDTDQYRLYVNGALSGSASVALAAPTLATFKLGSWFTGLAYWGGFAYSEFAVFGQALTASQVADLYARGLPLTDAGSTEKPGVYITDGQFRVASSLTGQRVEVTPEGIGIYDGSGTTGVVMELEPGAGSPYLAMGSPLPQSYLGDSGLWMGRDGTDGKYKLHLGTISGGALTQGLSWDGTNLQVIGSITVKGGDAATQSYANGVASTAETNAKNASVPKTGAAADINANVTTIDGGKITTNTIDASAIKTSTLTATRSIQLGASNQGHLVMAVNASQQATLTAYNGSGVSQVYFDTGGTLKAGGGKITLDSEALKFNLNSTTQVLGIKWMGGSTVYGSDQLDSSTVVPHIMRTISVTHPTQSAKLRLYEGGNIATCYIDIGETDVYINCGTRIGGTLSAGATTVSSLVSSGTITFAGTLFNGTASKITMDASYASFLTGGGAALPVKVGGLVVSNSYADGVTASNAYIKGNLRTGDYIYSANYIQAPLAIFGASGDQVRLGATTAWFGQSHAAVWCDHDHIMIDSPIHLPPQNYTLANSPAQRIVFGVRTNSTNRQYSLCCNSDQWFYLGNTTWGDQASAGLWVAGSIKPTVNYLSTDGTAGYTNTALNYVADMRVSGVMQKGMGQMTIKNGLITGITWVGWTNVA
jgi:hypothetical protein